MKSFQVVRTHLSPYQHQNFKELEKKAIEALPGLQYVAGAEADSQDLILITNTHTELSSLDPDLLKRTRLIVHPNSGYDHFEKDQKLWSDIPVVIGHSIRAPAVAEYTLGCLFQTQELPQHRAWVKNRLWDRKLIRDMKIWVYGLGHIGSRVAETLRTLGAHVTIIEPYKMNLTFDQHPHWSEGDRSQVDAHLLCCSLNKHSTHLFNEKFFKDLRTDAMIVNGARGKLIDENALKDFLQSNPRAQAFLDVFEEEPFTDHWIGFPQVWKTSHIAGVSRQLDQRIIDFEVQVLRDFMRDPTSFPDTYHNEILQNKFVDGVLI